MAGPDQVVAVGHVSEAVAQGSPEVEEVLPICVEVVGIGVVLLRRRSSEWPPRLWWVGVLLRVGLLGVPIIGCIYAREQGP